MKIKNLFELKEIVKDLKKQGKKIVWTNGCFDIIHIGHIRYLSAAKKLGDILIVGLNSDSSVKKLKGESRPIIKENERAEILSALEMIDYIFIFPETHVDKYIRELQPDIFAKGGDYSLETLDKEEVNAIKECGGKIELIKKVEDKSTSKLIEVIKK